MTREDFITRQRAYNRYRDRLFTISFIVIFGLLFAIGPIVDWIEEHRPLAWLDVAAYCAAVVGSPLLVVVFIVRARRKYGLLCPACGNGLTGACGQIAVATGKCGHCAAPVFDDG